jgi:hypothetical protein
MNKRKRSRAAWAVEWKQVYQRDRDERLQRVFAIIVPQTEAKTHHQNGEKPDGQTHRPLRQSIQ